MTYSLWLLPPAQSTVDASLRCAIKSLGCSFAPHVTLASKIPLSLPIDDIRSSLVTYLAEHRSPEVHINALDTGAEFYKRIFLRCQKSASLVSLARFSVTTFVDKNIDVAEWVKQYDPHISLIYAEKDACNDQELIDRLVPATFIDQSWKGGRIQLVDTSGSLSDWKTCLTLDLSDAHEST